MAQTIEALVDGGKANAGPLAPTLGPAGVNVGEVVAAINEKTKDFIGMQVPIKVILDDKKNFTITVGTPPASALIKDKLGIKSGSGNAKTTFVADMPIDMAKTIARMKWDDLQGKDLKMKTNEIVGTCTSMGVTIDGVNPREASVLIKSGAWDAKFQE
jgi:large subunit ribosomal protein L11